MLEVQWEKVNSVWYFLINKNMLFKYLCFLFYIYNR